MIEELDLAGEYNGAVVTQRLPQVLEAEVARTRSWGSEVEGVSKLQVRGKKHGLTADPVSTTTS